MTMSVSEAREYFSEHAIRKAAVRNLIQPEDLNPAIDMVFDKVYFYTEPGADIVCAKNQYGTVCFYMTKAVSFSESTVNDYDFEATICCDSYGNHKSKSSFILLIKV